MRYSSKEPSLQPTARFISGAEAKALYKIYQVLYRTFGPQHWWPGETTLEIIVGAILTQNTAWKNVEKALANLKEKDLLNLNRLANYPPEELARLLRPAGYYNIKTKRLLSVIQWLLRHDGIEKIQRLPTIRLRNELLHCYGIGPETADSILLYAFNRPVFVVDAYTRRILSRYGLITGKEPYEQLRIWLETSLKITLGEIKKRSNVVRLFNEFHALLVKLAKNHCRPSPICTGCPLNRIGSQYVYSLIKSQI